MTVFKSFQKVQLLTRNKGYYRASYFFPATFQQRPIELYDYLWFGFLNVNPIVMLVAYLKTLFEKVKTFFKLFRLKLFQDLPSSNK